MSETTRRLDEATETLAQSIRSLKNPKPEDERAFGYNKGLEVAAKLADCHRKILDDPLKTLPACPATEAAGLEARPLSLHRCKLCGTRWLYTPNHSAPWSLLDYNQRPGACCDNAAMGDQIEHLRDLPLIRSVWRPIETAPKGVDVLVTEGRFRVRVAFHGPAGWRTTPGDIGIHPTHWMQLPSPVEPVDDVSGALREARLYGDAGPPPADPSPLRRETLDEAIALLKHHRGTYKAGEDRYTTGMRDGFGGATLLLESLRQSSAGSASQPAKPEHVCGLAGYNGMIDSPCPACVANRERAKR